MKLTLTIEGNGEAFEHDGGRPETAVLLKKVALQIEAVTCTGESGGPILDINGNSVGSYAFDQNED